MDLALAEVRKQSCENRWLEDVLGRMRRVAMDPRLGIGAELRLRALVRSAAGAEHPVGHVVGAVVAAHGR